jgi:hypothetical protein
MSKSAQSNRTELIAKASTYKDGYGEISDLVNGLLFEYRKTRRELAKEKKRVAAAENALIEIMDLSGVQLRTPYGLNDGPWVDAGEIETILNRYLNGCATPPIR